MSVDINFVNKNNPEDSKAERIKKIKGISFAVLAITGLLAIIIFAIDYRFSASYVQKQQAELLSELSKYEDESAKIFIVNTKLTDISTILNLRKKYNNTTSQIAAGNTGNLSFDEYKIDESGVTLTVSSTSLPAMDEFLNYLISLNDEKVINSIGLKKLTFDSTRYLAEIVIL